MRKFHSGRDVGSGLRECTGRHIQRPDHRGIERCPGGGRARQSRRGGEIVRKAAAVDAATEQPEAAAAKRPRGATRPLPRGGHDVEGQEQIGAGAYQIRPASARDLLVRRLSPFVMAGLRCSYRLSTSLAPERCQDVDTRCKAGHDDRNAQAVVLKSAIAKPSAPHC
jgi:hypothetical protein